MKVTKISDAKLEDRSKDGIFTGGHVAIQFLSGAELPSETKEPVTVLQVNFSPGARTVFHIHSHPQILYVTKGIGKVGTEKEEITVTPGTIISIPAGENHWHGATKDSDFSYISITTPGQTKW